MRNEITKTYNKNLYSFKDVPIKKIIKIISKCCNDIHDLLMDNNLARFLSKFSKRINSSSH